MQYTVRPGDTLGKIAARNRTSVAAIMRDNPRIRKRNVIRVGQRITVSTETFRRPEAAGGLRPTAGRERGGSAGLYVQVSGLLSYVMDQLNQLSAQPAPVAQAGDPPWLTVAKKEMGVEEIKGPKRDPNVMAYIASTSGATEDMQDDKVPWCSAFVNWCMSKAGYEGTKSLMAISWKILWKDGKDVGKPAYGAIGIIWWHQSKAECLRALDKKGNPCKRVSWWDKPPKWLTRIGRKGCTNGHVGFVVGKRGERVVMLGGNQSDAVNLKAFSEGDFIGYMFPKGYAVPADAYDLPEYSGKQVKSATLAGTR